MPNTHQDVTQVLDLFGYEIIRQVKDAIRETRDRHPVDATCECEAMEALGVLVRLRRQGDLGTLPVEGGHIDE